MTVNTNIINTTNINHKQYLSDYKQHLSLLAKSQNTIDSYLSDLNQYFAIYQEINRSNIQEYKIKISGLSTSSINRKLTSLKQFNEYLLGKGLIGEVVVYKQDFIRQQGKGNPTNVTESQVNEFLNYVGNKDHIYKSRNVAIIYLIANTGIRREEITNLKLKNLHLENGILFVLGKGNKERKVYLNDNVIKVIKDWLKDRVKFKKAILSQYIFVSERSEKLHKNSINEIFNLYYTDDRKVGVHALRHNFATVSLEQDVLTLPELQNQLGHSSLIVTSIYTHAREDNIRKKINNLQIG